MGIVCCVAMVLCCVAMVLCCVAMALCLWHCTCNGMNKHDGYLHLTALIEYLVVLLEYAHTHNINIFVRHYCYISVERY